MPGDAELRLEPTPVDPRNKRRAARKYGSGERGFQVGEYPRVGPFEIYRARERTRDADKGDKGRTFYIMGFLDQRKPPPEGWAHWLLARFGPGTYRVSHKNNGLVGRGLIDVPRTLPPLMAANGRVPSDDDDEQDNPPMSAAGEILEQMEEMKRLREALGLSDKPEPGVLDALLKNPALMQLLAGLLAPKPPAPNPPAAAAPAPARPDPMHAAASFAAQRGLTPEGLIELVDRATRGPSGPDGDDEGDEDDRPDEDDQDDDGARYDDGADPLSALGG